MGYLSLRVKGGFFLPDVVSYHDQIIQSHQNVSFFKVPRLWTFYLSSLSVAGHIFRENNKK